MTDTSTDPFANTDEASDEITESAQAMSREDLDRRLDKLGKKLSKDLVEELRDMSKDDLKSRMSRCHFNILETKLAQELDEELQAAKERFKELNGPYSDALSHQKAVAEFAALRLRYE